jgi:hypothetical protein
MTVKIGRSRLCAAAAVLGVAVFGINADIEGAARKVESSSSLKVGKVPDIGVRSVARASSRGASNAGLSLDAWLQRQQQVPPGGYPIFAPQIVDYRNDEPSRLRREGLLDGPMLLPEGMGAIATGHTVCSVGSCTFDIDCDDGDPCTEDTCTIPPEGPICQGTCTNPTVLDGLAGRCDDGLFCNGVETCQSGACTAGSVPACCAGTIDEPAEVCSEDIARCSPESEVAGRRCTEDDECPGGVCDHCVDVCTTDADCDDRLGCNGVETCNGGICQAGPPTCGSGANCFESRCRPGLLAVACASDADCESTQTCSPRMCTGFNGAACTEDVDCPAGQTCISALVCFVGRCCPPDAAVDDCLALDLSDCLGIPGSSFYPGDEGQDTQQLNECGGTVPLFTSGRQQLGCPSYTSGIVQKTTAVPNHPVNAGPMSFSLIPVPNPGGPGGADGLHRIGDDYCNAGGQHIAVEAVRFVGAMTIPDAIFVEYWAADGSFIEDTLFRPSLRVGVNTFYLTPPLILPPCGRIAARTKIEFEPEARFIWASADGADEGTNDPTILFVNDDPNHVIASSGMLGGNPGVLSFELAGRPVGEPRGGCCHLGQALCTNEVKWVCEKDGTCDANVCVGSINAGASCTDDKDCTGVFQGIGSFCAGCEGGSNAGAACQTCTGDMVTPCDADSDCAGAGGTCAPNDNICNAGGATCSNNDEVFCADPSECPPIPSRCSNSLNACVDNNDCPGGICSGQGSCDAGTCVLLDACSTGACCDAGGSCSVTLSANCVGTFQGEGTDCEPNCCTQPTVTGKDHCSEVVIDASNTIPVLQPNSPPVVLTFTGNNSLATAVADATYPDGDSCFGIATTTGSDRGWWEGFSLEGVCTRVRIDLCCTTPTAFANWPWLATDCSCNEIVVATLDPDTPDLQPNDRGQPFCDEDNLWNIMGQLGPGSYYYSIRSALEGTLGPYTFHVVASPCPDAACCKLDGTCDTLNLIECNAIGGFYLGSPNKFPATFACVNSPATCGVGSCCFGPGLCEDEALGVPYDQATCTGAGGTAFRGGVSCEGGTCALNSAYSCADLTDCEPNAENPNRPGCPGGGLDCCISPGGPRSLAQANPCPICEFESPLNCQSFEFGGNGAISDLGQGVGILQADDFIPSAGFTELGELCIWGFYMSKDPDATAAEVDCSQRVLADNFRVRVYKDNGFGLPGDLVGESTATRVRVETEDTDAGFGAATPWGYQLTLETGTGTATPITGLVPDETHWLEVVNNIPPEDTCYWVWSLLEDATNSGNAHMATTSAPLGDYRIGGEGRSDAAWCMPQAVTAPPTPVRPSCGCAGDCAEQTLLDSQASLRAFNLQAVDDVTGNPLVCADFVCALDGTPSNDDCANALDVSVGFYTYETFCATTDGLLAAISDFSPDTPSAVANDLWYTFTAAQDCTLRVDQCATGTIQTAGFDGILGVYTNGTDTCECPITDEVAERTRVHTTGNPWLSDEGCCLPIILGCPGIIEVPAIAGQCFMIRAAAWGGGTNTRGRGVLDISCGDPVCGDGTVQAALGEQCDGNDLSGCNPGEACIPAGVAGECTCQQAVCGNQTVEGSEECDGTDDSACPGACNLACECVPVCGNGLDEPGEDCDGSDDSFCPGRCEVGCTCPPKFCGNDFVDPSEECDGTSVDACPDGACRVPGDPAGECTCACIAVVPEVDPVVVGAGSFDRFVELVLPASSAGTETAFRVTLTSLYQPGNPQPINPPDFSGSEGEVRYLNLLRDGNGAVVTDCLSSAAFSTTFKCATVSCTPEFADWGTLFGGVSVFVSGNAIIPDSAYTVAHLAPSCVGIEASCTATSEEVAVATARFGNANGDAFTNVNDIVNTVDVVKDVFGAPWEYQVYVRNPIPSPQSESTNVTDIVAHVDAAKLVPYVLVITPCP